MQILGNLKDLDLRFGQRLFGDDDLQLGQADQHGGPEPTFAGDQRPIGTGQDRLQLLGHQRFPERAKGRVVEIRSDLLFGFEPRKGFACEHCHDCLLK